MISRLLAILLCGLGTLPARAVLAPTIIGQWQYDGFLYEGHRYPNPNPDLTLTFEFRSDGIDRLYWSRKNEPGFCERLATYQLNQNHLQQKVVWVNPKNDASCRNDSDMQLGAESNVEIVFKDLELWFHLDLNGKPFEYILVSIPATGNTPVFGPQ